MLIKLNCFKVHSAAEIPSYFLFVGSVSLYSGVNSYIKPVGQLPTLPMPAIYAHAI